MKFIRNIFVLINIILAATLLLAYLSYHVSPAKIGLLAFFGLAYPYILIVNVLFCLYWIFRKKKAFLISFVVIALGFNHVKSTAMIFRFNKEKSDEFSNLKICTYNVRLFNHYKWDTQKNVYDSIVRFVSNEKVDIVCFQEFFYLEDMSPRLSDIKKGLKTTKHFHIDHFEHTKNIYYGIATFSKYPIINKGEIRFKNSLNSAIYTDILVSGDTIRIYNNHLQSYKIHNKEIEFIGNFKFEYNQDQMRQAKSLSSKMYQAYVQRAMQVDEISDHIKNSPYPVIVCGDFNDTPVSYAYHKMKGKLKDSFVESGYGVSNTYNGNIPSFRIDYIFYDPGFSSQNYERKKIKFSDHFPVMCELKIK